MQAWRPESALRTGPTDNSSGLAAADRQLQELARRLHRLQLDPAHAADDADAWQPQTLQVSSY
jgi:hypothetical protein